MAITLLLAFGSQKALARENVTDWYVKDFSSRIEVNKDSSLDITETILADCGTASGKHGIFRILPEEIAVVGRGKIKNPVELLSIKDGKGNEYSYSQIKNNVDKTVTWKIGDANRTVQGENTYVIHYRVKNAIRFWNEGFDEFYWNLTGNFWDLEIDHARIEVIFPKEIMNDEISTNLYSGALGVKGNLAANFYWGNDANLVVETNRTLAEREGVTVSVTFPKGIFMPYQPSLWEEYEEYLFFLWPLLIFFICFSLWKKYGDDPAFNKTIIAQYAPPKDLSPIEMGLLMTNGKFKNHFITAEIINFAVSEILTIKETENKILFFEYKNYEFIRSNNPEAESNLNEVQKMILDKIFEEGGTVKISALKNNFYKIIGKVKKGGNALLDDKKLIIKTGLTYSNVFIPLGMVIIFLSIPFLSGISLFMALNSAISGIVILLFGFIMPKRTLAGENTNWELKGFKLFMETVDKDRAAFYEKENIFEKFLPYAILFEITEEWIKRMKEIYGEAYFASHVPAWYIGSTLGSFNVDEFSSSLTSLSTSIAANTSSPSGSGGSGGAGGGGGGGGGGGW